MIFQSLLLFTAVIGAIATLLTIVGANLYDLQHIRQQRQHARRPNARQYRRRPLITIIIPTHNDARLIERTLHSIVSSSYRKVEIIVVDRNSQDSTKQITRQFIAAHANKKIRLSAKRRLVSVPLALADAYHTHASGELALWLQPGQVLDKLAFTNAVMHFNSQPELSGLSLSRRLHRLTTTASLFQRFELLLGYRFRKFDSIFNTDYALTADGVMYNRAAADRLLAQTTLRSGKIIFPNLMMLQGNHSARLAYASDAVVYVTPLTSFRAFMDERYRLQLSRLAALRSCRKIFFSRDPAYSKFLTWFRLPLAACVGLAALCAPILLSYVMYLAVRLHQPELYYLSWILVTLLTVFAVWGDDRLQLRQKASCTLLAPITQAIVYLLSFVQLFVLASGLLFPLRRSWRLVGKI